MNEAAPLDKVCLLGCGLSTGYGAALNTAKVSGTLSSWFAFGLFTLYMFNDKEVELNGSEERVEDLTWIE